MDPFYFCVALGPLCVYFLLIGRINLYRRSWVTTGTRDLMTLAIALTGFVVAGPLRLFMPEGLVGWMGAWSWLPLIALYGFCCLLAILLMRPRLVVYNARLDRLKPVLESVALTLDDRRQWAGNSLSLPSMGVELTIEPFDTLQNVQLVAVGGVPQNLVAWAALERELKHALATQPVEANPRGTSFLLLGLLTAAMIIYSLNREPAAVAQALDQFLMK